VGLVGRLVTVGLGSLAGAGPTAGAGLTVCLGRVVGVGRVVCVGRVGHGRLGNLAKSGARFSLKASRPSWASSLM
jgi:hypothetical protein